MDEQTGLPILGARVHVEGSTATEGFTDTSGFIQMTLPVGRYAVACSHMGYALHRQPLNLLSDQRLTIYLAPTHQSLDDIVVTARAGKNKVLTTQMGVERVDRKTALELPAIMGEVDILKVFQLKPGVKNTGEGTSGISVRGGGVDQNLFLFDGTTVYNPNHLFGFFSTFNIDAVKEVELYKAGFSAAYSGRLSSIVDVKSLPGADTSWLFSGGIGLIATRLNLTGNLLHRRKTDKKLTFNVAARRTYADVFTRMVNEANSKNPDFDPIPSYYFYDLNARIDYIHSDKDHVFGSVYYGRDFFRLEGNFSTKFSWGNAAGSVHWSHQFSEDLSVNTSLHFANYNYRLRSQFDQFSFSLGSGISEYTAAQHWLFTKWAKHRIQWGWDATRSRFDISKFSINSSNPNEDLTSGEELFTHEGGVYLKDELDITTRLRADFGMRFTWFQYQTGYTGWEPRTNLRYRLSPEFSVKASYARMRQYKHLVASSGASLPTDIWYPSTRHIQPETSDQLSIGYVWKINNQFVLTNEAYYKWLRRLVDFKPGANLFVNQNLEQEFVFGSGRSYGAEWTLEKTAGKWKGWIAYTLAWTNRTFSDINGGRTFYPRFDRRHELAIVATYPINKRMTFSTTWIFYTGNAVSLPTGRYITQGAPATLNSTSLYTFVPVYPERGNYRMPNYHRLDLGLVYRLRPRRGNADLTFSVYNAYSRLNVFFISFRELESTATGVPGRYEPRAITLFPLLPSITYNFRF